MGRGRSGEGGRQGQALQLSLVPCQVMMARAHKRRPAGDGLAERHTRDTRDANDPPHAGMPRSTRPVQVVHSAGDSHQQVQVAMIAF